jgi:hypothetical protein
MISMTVQELARRLNLFASLVCFITDKRIPMATRQVIIEVPGKVLLAEKTDEISFSR